MNQLRSIFCLVVLTLFLLSALPAFAITPTLTIGAPSATATKNGPVSYTLTYTNATTVTLTTGDITLNTSGTATGTVSISGTGASTRVVNIDAISGDGSIGISVAGGTASDDVGNAAPAASSATSFKADNTAPVISISSPTFSGTRTGPVSYTVTYTDANFNISTLKAADITLNSTGTANGSVAVTGTGITRTVTISAITGEGSLGISIGPGTASDQAGNTAPAVGPSATFTCDSIPPTLSVGTPSVAFTKAGPVSYTLTYADTNFSASTLVPANITLLKTGSATGSVSSVTGSGTTRTVTIGSVSGTGTLAISIVAATATDQAGNTAPALVSSTPFIVDNTNPTISIGAPSSPHTASGPVTYTVTYGDTNFDTSSLSIGNIILTRTGTADGIVSVDGGSGSVRTVTISSITGNGTLKFSIAAGTAVDLLGNLAPASGVSATITVDNTAPTVSIGPPSITGTKTGPVSFVVTYADANFNSSTLVPANITLNKTGTASGSVAVTGTGTTRTVTISSITGEGTLGISLPAGTGSDLAGNSAPAAGPSATFTCDSILPVISVGAPSLSSTKSGPVTYTVTYTDTNFSASTLTAANVTLSKTGTATGTVSVDSGSGATRTVTINSISGTGTLAISIAAGTARDVAGNLAPLSGSSTSFIVDNTNPAIGIGSPSVAYTGSGSVTYTVSYTDTNFISSSLSLADITLNTTGTATGTVSVGSGTGASRTVTISAISGEGSLGISIGAGTGVDITGNTAPASAASTVVTVDNTSPTISIGSPSATTTRTGPVSYVISYGDANFSTSSLAPAQVTLISTGTATGTIAVTGTGTTRTVTISAISGDGTLGISIASGTASDLAGNTAPAAGPSATFLVDNTAPTISVGSPSVASTRGGPVTYSVTYADANFSSSLALTATSVTLVKTGSATGTVTVDNGTGQVRTLTISNISGTGTLGISIAKDTASDTSGNKAPVSGNSTLFIVDNTAPTITVSAPSAVRTSSGPVSYTVTYSDTNPGPVTLSQADITLNATGTATGTVFVSGSGSTRTVTISSISGDGTLGISIASGTCSDVAGNSAPATAPSATFTVDNSAPTISIGAPSTTSTKTGPVSYTVTYADASFNATTLTSANVTLIRTGTATGTVAVSGTGATTSGATRTVTISSISGEGSLRISIAANTASDLLGNSAPASAVSAAFSVDSFAPTVSISAPTVAATKTGPVSYTVTYADANFNTSTLLPANITLNRTGNPSGTVSVSGSGTSYTVTISSISGTGTMGISIGAGTASDLAGNSAPAVGPSATFIADSLVPVITIGAPSATIASTGPITYTVTYADANFAGSTLTAADITLNKTGSATGTVSVDSGSGANRTVTINSISGDGTLGISLAAGTSSDLSGNSAPSAGPSATFTVDNSLPLSAITVPANSSFVSGASTVVRGTAADAASFVQRVELSTDNGMLWSTASGSNSWSFTWALPLDGTYPVLARAVDSAGNVQAPPSAISVTISSTPPETFISSAPSDPSIQPVGSFTFKSSKPGSTFECMTDSVAFVACQSPYSTVALADGRHSLTVRAKDPSGAYDPSPAIHTWTVNSSARIAVLSGVPPSPSAIANAVISVAGPGIVSYQFQLDSGAWSAEVPIATPITISGLTDGPHTLKVKGRDSLANTLQSIPTCVIWTVETTLPTTTILRAPASLSASPSGMFIFRSSKPGTTFLCQLDGGSFAPCASPYTYSALVNGTHSLAVRGIDLIGNSEPSPAGYSWMIDTLSTIAVLSNTPPALTNSTTATIQVSGPGIVAYRYSLDAGAYTADVDPSLPISLKSLSNGAHALSVVGKNADGIYQTSPTSIVWTVDTVAPTTTIISQPAAVSNTATGNIAFTSSKPGSTFLCKLDTSAATICSSPYGFVGLGSGAHKVTITATDPAGNIQSTATTASWTVDIVPPTAALVITPTVVPALTYKLGDVVTFTATFSKAMAISPVPQIVLGGGNILLAGDMQRVDATHYTYKHTVGAGSGTVIVSLATGTDTSGNTVVATPTAGTTFTVVKSTQTMTFDPIASRMLGDAPFALSATVSSGRPITYSSSRPDVASISGNMVTITGVGTTVITASQINDPTYLPVSATQNFTVSYSSVAPSLSLSTLPDGAVTAAATLNISGLIFCQNGTKAFTINGVPVTVAQGGSFSQALTLRQGANRITSVVIDNAGLITQDTRTITLEISAPALTVSSPVDNSMQSSSLVTITGTITDPSATVTAGLNGGTPQFAAINGNSFSITLNLIPGLNTIFISATNLAGTTATLKRTVVFDSTRPGLVITDPAQDTISLTKTMLLSGMVTDALSAVTVSITMDGNSYTPQVVNGAFQQQLTFGVAKQYAITVTATDQAGNSSTVQRNVIFSPASSGDINNDGIVDVSDALMALRMAVGLITPTAAELSAGDVSPQSGGKPAPDGIIDISDALLILRKVVGLVTW
ncbi:MAG: hypothetical protein HXX11_01435 [Desulfuromonadales bacterium]|nr:hypothetical protein [Desulfuromonadales bacterium]